MRIGAFEISGKLPGGAGGQGMLYIARCVEPVFEGLAPGTEVVVKVMNDDPDAGDSAQKRLLRRTEACAALRHPGIVRYYGCFTYQEILTNRHVVVMELLRGETLKERMAREPLGMEADIALDVCRVCLDALAYAREKGVLHRDLTPSNIFLCEDGGVKLIDFEVAKTVDAARSQTTTTGLVGKFDYLAPELIKGGAKPNELTDIFSFAICAHEAFSGKYPFEQRGSMGQIHGAPVVDKKRLRALVPGLEEIIARALADDPGKRPQTFAILAEEFNRLKLNAWRGTEGRVYKTIQYIGAGGFGVVYKARVTPGNQIVALKYLLDTRYSDRFRREAEALKKFSDDRLVRCLDYFKDESGLGDSAFLVMNFLPEMPGSSLYDRLKIQRAEKPDGRARPPGAPEPDGRARPPGAPEPHAGLDAREVAAAFARYAGGLAVMHAVRMFHRDIKPSNLYLPAGAPHTACIMDFGIIRNEEGTLTHGKHIPGTPDYMAPEFAGKNTGRGSAASDLYALALCLHEALTGRRVFQRLPKDPTEAWREFVRRALLSEPPKPEFAEPVRSNPRLLDLLTRMLDPDPDKRLADAALVAKTLEEIFNLNEEPDEPSRTSATIGIPPPEADPEESRTSGTVAVSAPLPQKPAKPAKEEKRKTATMPERPRKNYGPFIRKFLKVAAVLAIVGSLAAFGASRYGQVVAGIREARVARAENKALKKLDAALVEINRDTKKALDASANTPETAAAFLANAENTLQRVNAAAQTFPQIGADIRDPARVQSAFEAHAASTNELHLAAADVREKVESAAQDALNNACAAYNRGARGEGEKWAAEWRKWTNRADDPQIKNAEAACAAIEAAAEADALSQPMALTVTGALSDEVKIMLSMEAGKPADRPFTQGMRVAPGAVRLHFSRPDYTTAEISAVVKPQTPLEIAAPELAETPALKQLAALARDVANARAGQADWDALVIPETPAFTADANRAAWAAAKDEIQQGSALKKLKALQSALTDAKKSNDWGAAGALAEQAPPQALTPQDAAAWAAAVAEITRGPALQKLKALQAAVADAAAKNTLEAWGAAEALAKQAPPKNLSAQEAATWDAEVAKIARSQKIIHDEEDRLARIARKNRHIASYDALAKNIAANAALEWPQPNEEFKDDPDTAAAIKRVADAAIRHANNTAEAVFDEAANFPPVVRREKLNAALLLLNNENIIAYAAPQKDALDAAKEKIESAKNTAVTRVVNNSGQAPAITLGGKKLLPATTVVRVENGFGKAIEFTAVLEGHKLQRGSVTPLATDPENPRVVIAAFEPYVGVSLAEGGFVLGPGNEKIPANADGKWSLTPGTYTAVFSRKGYRDPPPMEFVVTAGPAIKVVPVGDWEPLPVTVTLAPGHNTITATLEGERPRELNIYDLPPGNYTAVFEKKGQERHPGRVAFTVRAADEPKTVAPDKDWLAQAASGVWARADKAFAHPANPANSIISYKTGMIDEYFDLVTNHKYVMDDEEKRVLREAWKKYDAEMETGIQTLEANPRTRANAAADIAIRKTNRTLAAERVNKLAP